MLTSFHWSQELNYQIVDELKSFGFQPNILAIASSIYDSEEVLHCQFSSIARTMPEQLKSKPIFRPCNLEISVYRNFSLRACNPKLEFEEFCDHQAEITTEFVNADFMRQ